MNTYSLITLPTLAGAPIIARQTEKALWLEVADGHMEWMPKSQIVGFVATCAGVFLVTSAWITREKGLSYRAKSVSEAELNSALSQGTATWIDIGQAQAQQAKADRLARMELEPAKAIDADLANSARVARRRESNAMRDRIVSARADLMQAQREQDDRAADRGQWGRNV